MNMYNYKKNLNKNLSKKFKQKLKKNKYIFICKYNNLLSNQIIDIKIFLKNLNMKHKIMKQSLFDSKYKLKGQGSLLIIYFNNYNDIYDLMLFLKNYENIYLIKLLENNNLMSVIKLNQILNKKIILSLQLKKLFIKLNNIFLKIK